MTETVQTLHVSAAGGVTTVTLNRPEIHNAFDDHLIAELTRLFVTLDTDPDTRVVILTGAGKSFSAGGDLNWMKRVAAYTPAENEADAGKLAALLRAIDRCRKPVIARVQGNAFAGGVGLIAACDIAVAVDTALFAVTEVRIGLIPAVISPYLVRAMGMRWTRRLTLTAERIDAVRAAQLGLIHQAVPVPVFDHTIDMLVRDLLLASPAALSAAKDLLSVVEYASLDEPLAVETARRIAIQRASEDGREGLGSFLDKRKPGWVLG